MNKQLQNDMIEALRFSADAPVNVRPMLEAALRAAELLGFAMIRKDHFLTALRDNDSPIIMRRNKACDDGRQWEVIRRDNDDWRDCITEERTVLGRFASEAEASRHYDFYVGEWRWQQLLEAAGRIA